MDKYYYEITLRNHVDDAEDDLLNGYILIDESTTDVDSIEEQILETNKDAMKDFIDHEIIFIDKIVKETN